MKEFKGRTAVITGAGSGIGEALASFAASLGMRLVLADIDQPAVQRVASRLADTTEVLAQQCDVANADAVQALARLSAETFGPVHLLFNNAGVGGGGGFVWENSLQDWQWGLGVNVWGVIHGIHHFVPAMAAAALRDPGYEGCVINTSSMAGFFNPPIMAVYNASKQAVTAISETLYHDLRIAELPIHCSLLAPFYVPTNIDQSECHRPQELMNQTTLTRSQIKNREQSKAGMGSGKLSPFQVAEITFSAIRDQRFYVFPHPRMLQSVRARMQAILEQSYPTDPFSFRPKIFQTLQEQLSYQKLKINPTDG